MVVDQTGVCTRRVSCTKEPDPVLTEIWPIKVRHQVQQIDEPTANGPFCIKANGGATVRVIDHPYMLRLTETRRPETNVQASAMR